MGSGGRKEGWDALARVSAAEQYRLSRASVPTSLR